MRYTVEIETRDCGDECPGHFEASVIRGPKFTRDAGGLSVFRAVAFDETARAIRMRYLAHTFDFIHTAA